MAGISDMAALKPGNPSKFNSGTELDSSLALNWYETPFRGYDPQIGKFNEPDPLGEKYPGINAYQFAYNMPNMFIDPWGLEDGDSTIITNPNGNPAMIGEGLTSPDNGQTIDNANGQEVAYWDSQCECYRSPSTNSSEEDNPGTFQFYSRGTDLAGEIIRPLPPGFQMFGTADEWEAAAGTTEKAGKAAEVSELTAKYTNMLMKANELSEINLLGMETTSAELQAAQEFFRTAGTVAGGISIGVNGYRYARGDISGTEFATSTAVTGSAIVASFFLGPEAGITIEAGAWAAPIIYNDVNNWTQQASQGISSWTQSIENSAANAEIGH